MKKCPHGLEEALVCGLCQRELLRAMQSNIVDVVNVLTDINSKLGSGLAAPRLPMAERDDVILRVQSVEVEDNSRGTTAKVKAFAPTIEQAENEALASIQRVRERLRTIGQCQAAAEDLAKALVGVLTWINEQEIDSTADALGPAYQALAKAGYEA